MIRLAAAYSFTVALLVSGALPVAASEPPATSELHAALQLQPRSAHGARIFRTCVRCHGADAAGSPNGMVPSLAGQHFRYLVKQIAQFRSHDRFAGDIHDQVVRTAFETPQAIADVAAYLAELPPSSRPLHGPGTALERGSALYRASCESCHLPSGAGSDAAGVPVLRRQNYQYLVTQMRDMALLHRVNTPAALRALLTQMPVDDVEALADYLSRLP